MLFGIHREKTNAIYSLNIDALLEKLRNFLLRRHSKKYLSLGEKGTVTYCGQLTRRVTTKSLSLSKFTPWFSLVAKLRPNLQGTALAEPTRVARRVLVVDDSNSARYAVSYVLKKDGFDVVCVADAVEAVARFSKDSFDLVLSDFAMPGMDGLSLTHEIHRLAPNTPIIVMSGHPEVKRENVLGAGAVDFIEKPILLNNLLAKIEIALRPDH